MKKKFVICLLLFVFYFLVLSITEGLFFVAQSNAVSASPSATTVPSQTSLIDQLKEKIASKVAELRLVEKRGILGKATDVTNSQITLSDSKDNTRFIDVDELTKFASPSAKGTFGISDITKGTQLGILGLYNKQSQRLLARFVDVVNMPLMFHGTIVTIDTASFTFEIVTDAQKTQTIDVENITKTLSFTKDTSLLRSGFSKLVVNEHVIVIGFPDNKDRSKILASRILVFPDIPKNPKITIQTTIETSSAPTTAAILVNNPTIIKGPIINSKSIAQKNNPLSGVKPMPIF